VGEVTAMWEDKQVSKIVLCLKKDRKITFEVSGENITVSEVLDLFNKALAPRRFEVEDLKKQSYQ
jgi:hypothetical protein